MADKITQGSIIYGILSNKYFGIRCYGIVISARCDIANCKVPKFYYLVAVDVADWLTSDVGFPNDYSAKSENSLLNFHQRYKLNHSDMITFADEEIESVINTHISKKSDREKYLQTYKEFKRFDPPEFDCIARQSIIRANNQIAATYFDKILKGDIIHYCFIPQASYLKNGVNTRGIIVDLQEIEILSMDDAVMIQSGGIDFKFQDFTIEEKKTLKSRYYLNNEDDFVQIEGHVESPQIEQLMQRFSNSFTRVGIDGVTATDCKNIISAI